MLILPCALVWFAADRLGIMEARQFAVLGMVWVALLACLGIEVVGAMAVPLAYLVFLVPFGAFIVPALQQVTAGFVNIGLAVLGVPHVVDQNLIEIPEGTFRVAEACAGLRFLIASIAFGALYAATIYRSTGRRVLFLAGSVIVPVVANGFRALGIVLLGHFRGSAEAGAVDHVVYGWIFFSVVILALLMLGLRFREDGTRLLAPVKVRPSGARPVVAVAACVVLAALGPASGAVLDRRASGEVVPGKSAALLDAFAVPAGCTGGAATDDVRVLACGETRIVMRAAVFGPHAGLGLVLPALRQADPSPLPDAQGETEDVAHAPVAVVGGAWSVASIGRPEAATASAVWIGSSPVPAGLAQRVALARGSVVGAARGPVVVTLAATGPNACAVVMRLARALSPVVASALD